jgi:hypothetical protein
MGSSHGSRRFDGLMLGDAPPTRVYGELLDISGREVIAGQAHSRRLVMPFMGQTLFSRELVWALGPLSATAVALCTSDDSILRPLLEASEGCFVEVYAPKPGMD